MNLFVLTTISIKEKTEKDLRKEWEIRNMKYDNHIPYERYLELLEDWGNKKYDYDFEDNCYFLSLDVAKERAKSNVADLNDGGVYNYIAITEMPLEAAYAMAKIKNIYIFEFNPDERKYKEVQLNHNDKTELILKKNCCSYLLKKN